MGTEPGRILRPGGQGCFLRGQRGTEGTQTSGQRGLSGLEHRARTGCPASPHSGRRRPLLPAGQVPGEGELAGAPGSQGASPDLPMGPAPVQAPSEAVR